MSKFVHRPLTAAFPQVAIRKHEPTPKAHGRLRPSARPGRAVRTPAEEGPSSPQAFATSEILRLRALRAFRSG